MGRYRLPNSIRKFIRKEKARIRRAALNKEEVDKRIEEFVQNIFKKYGKLTAIPK